MANMTVRNLPDEVHRCVKAIADQRGVSAEVAVRSRSMRRSIHDRARYECHFRADAVGTR